MQSIHLLAICTVSSRRLDQSSQNNMTRTRFTSQSNALADDNVACKTDSSLETYRELQKALPLMVRPESSDIHKTGPRNKHHAMSAGKGSHFLVTESKNTIH